MTTAHCAVCNATLTLIKGALPFCKTYSCARGYSHVLFADKARPEGEHLIWQGSFRKDTQQPFLQLRYFTGEKWTQYQISPRALAWNKAGREAPPKGATLRRWCEHARCIAPDHTRVIEQSGKFWDVGFIPPKLPVLPLVRAIAARGAEFDLPEPDYKAVKWASENSGQIDLYIADRICCDALGVHPYAIWQEAFYDAT